MICLLGIERKEKIEVDFELFAQLVLLISEIVKSQHQTKE